MSYQRTTVSLHSVAPDLIPQDAPADVWNYGKNVAFRNGETVRVNGDSPTLPTDKAPRTMVFLRVQGLGYWVYATDLGIYAHDGSIETDITPAAGWSGVETFPTFTSCVLSGVAYLNASDRDPVYWDGNPSNLCQPLPDWPSAGRCLALRAHKNFLFAIGMLSEGGFSGQRIRWSDAAEAGAVPDTWTPGPDNFAGFLDLAPLSSPARDAVTIRDEFLIMKEESIWSLSLIGGNSVFQARKLFAEHGLHATNAVCRGPNDEILFVGEGGDVYLTDGVQVKSALDGRAQRTFYAGFSGAHPTTFSAVTLMREKLGMIIYPNVGTDADQALMFDFASGDIGFREMPDTFCAGEGQVLSDIGDANQWDADDNEWDTDTQRWNEIAANASADDVVIGGDFGFLQVSDDTANDFYMGPVAASVEKSGIAFGNPQGHKLINRVWPKLSGTVGDIVQIRIGSQDVTGGPVSLGPVVDYTIGVTTSVDTFTEGRFLSIEISSNGGSPWRLGSIDIEYREVGRW